MAGHRHDVLAGCPAFPHRSAHARDGSVAHEGHARLGGQVDERLRDRGALERDVPFELGNPEAASVIVAIPLVVWFRPVIRHDRVGEHSAVVWKLV
jgi:hypothetical protein